MNQEKQETINVAKETLTGDLRDFIIDRERHFSKTWQQMTEDEQQQEIDCATTFSKNIIEKAVHIIASEGREVVEAEIGKIVVDKGIKAEIRVSAAYADTLISAQGLPVLIVTNGSSEFTGERGKCEPDPQEPEFFNAEYKEDDGAVIPEPLSFPSPEPLDAEFSD